MLALFAFKKLGIHPGVSLSPRALLLRRAGASSGLPPLVSMPSTTACLVVLLFSGSVLGQGHVVPCPDSRACARSWPFGTFSSVYGPASHADVPWFAKTLELLEASDAPVLVGDFNWRPAYERFLPSAWACSRHAPTTVEGAAGPTRLVAYNVPCPSGPCEVCPLPGIPHHAATLWTISASSVPCTRPRRLLRCAEYVQLRDPTPQETNVLADAERARAAALPRSSLRDRLAHWHRRAEHVLKHAVAFGILSQTRPGERGRGAPVATKPASPKPLVCRDEPVSLRRLRRLHRAAVEIWRRGPDLPLTRAQRGHWHSAFRDGLFPGQPLLPAHQAAAVAMASTAISLAERRLANERSSELSFPGALVQSRLPKLSLSPPLRRVPTPHRTSVTPGHRFSVTPTP